MDRKIMELVEPKGSDTLCRLDSVKIAFSEEPFNLDIVYQTGSLVDASFVSSGVDTLHIQDDAETSANPEDVINDATIFLTAINASADMVKALEDCLISEGVAI